MLKLKYAVLVIFITMFLIFPPAVFSMEKADKDAILQELSVFMDKSPEVIKNAIYAMADEYIRGRKIDEAAALYEKALKAFPDNKDFLSRLGDLYIQKENYAKAIDVYKKMTEINSDNAWNFQMLSYLYARSGDSAKASLVWEDILKKSRNAEIFAQAANFYTGMNDAEKALMSMKKAVEFAPDNVGYAQNLTDLYVKAGKFAEAEALCNKILSASSEEWVKSWANSELIDIYERQNKLQELAVKFERDIASGGKDVNKYKNLAEIYIRNNENEKATALYEKAIAAGVDDRDMNGRLLDLYERANKIDKFETQAKKMIEAVPDDNYIYERLAGVLYLVGREEDAKKVWENLLIKMPDNIGVVTRYGDRLSEWGDFDRAVAQYRKAQELDSNNLLYTMRVADIYITEGKLDEAKKELNNIIAKTKDEWIKQQAENKIEELNLKLKDIMPAVISAAQKIIKPETKKKGF